MQNQTISILNLPCEMRYLQIDLTTYIQKRFRSRLLGFWSLPKLKVVSEAENRRINGAATSLINFSCRTIFINVNPALNPARQWEEALGDTVHENLHDVWDLFPKDEKWDAIKQKLMNIFMDGRNEQFAAYSDDLCRELLQNMRKHAFADLENKITRKQWFDGDALWASAYLSLKIHTGLMATAPELVSEFQSGVLSPAKFWRRIKKVLRLRNPPASLKWKEAWKIICKFWLSENIYPKSKLADEFRGLYPVPDKIDTPASPEDRQGHTGQPLPGGGGGGGENESGETKNGGIDDTENGSGTDGETRSKPNNIPKPGKPKSGEEIEQEIKDESQSSTSGSPNVYGGQIFPADGRELETAAKDLSSYLKREISILTAPRQREITVTSNRIRMQKVLKNTNTRDPWKKKKETEINRNVISLKFIGDTSGSMDDSGKLDAMRLALAVFHEVCSKNAEVEHTIYTSVGFQKIADKKWSRTRVFNLLAGLDTFCGDDFEQSLPLLFNEVKGGREIVFVFTDGQPCGLDYLAQIIGKAKKSGTIVFGVGLNITNESDRKGMEILFGEDKLLSTIHQNNGEEFAKNMAVSLRNLVRRRLLS